MKRSIIIIFLFLSASILMSREITIKVMDKDIDIPLEGVKIFIKNTEQTGYTDKDGMVKIIIADNLDKIIIYSVLIGYSPLNKLASNLDEIIILYMSIESVIHGRELVIEDERIKKDEKLGVSKVIDSEEIKSTSKIGIVEDAMNSIKFLPGISYGQGFDPRISIRGGHPDEQTMIYDGFIIRYPLQWGLYSIFNPNILDNIKFSPGIFNVKNGLTMSGLMEFESIKPDRGLHFRLPVTSSSIEFYMEIPLAKISGLLLGTKITYYDPIMIIYEKAKEQNPDFNDGTKFSTYPNIRDAYLKWFIRPDDRFECFINGIFVSDSIGLVYNEENDYKNKSDITTYWDFRYYNYYAIGTTGFNIYPIDKILINFLAGYEFLSNRFHAYSYEKGKNKYSEEFIDYCANHDPVIPLASTEYEIKKLETDFYQDTITNNVQTRLDFDFKLHDKITLSTGAGMLLDFLSLTGYGKYYRINYESGVPFYEKESFDIADDIDKQKQILKSYLYLNLLINIIPSKLELEAGCRLDHAVFIAEGFDDGSLNTYPVASPRLLLTYTVINDKKSIKKLSFSTGAGLFSKVPSIESAVTSKYGVNDFDLVIPKLLTTVLSSEIEFVFGLKIKFEGYYKFYFHRAYLIFIPSSDPDESTVHYHADGIGHTGGFEITIEKNLTRFVGGMINYSFIYARYINPQNENIKNNTTLDGEPTGYYFYPEFHRFHIINLVLNIKPTSWFTITIMNSLGSGQPKKRYKDKKMFAAVLDDEDQTIVEMYTRETLYDDFLRKNFYSKLDLKMTFSFYFPKKKLNFDAYFGVEDLLKYVFPSESVQTDRYSGEETLAPNPSTSFPIIPTIGITLSF